MRKGSVTIFTALIFPVILALVMTLLESARISATQVKVRDAGNAAISSVMAGYNRNLLEDYGLLFYDGGFNSPMISTEKLEEEFSDYAAQNLRNDFASPGSSLFPAYVSSASVQSLVTATDYQGEVFIRSALDFFKYDAVGEVIELLEQEIKEMGDGDSAKSNAQNDTDRLMTTDWNAYLGAAGKPNIVSVRKVDPLEEREPLSGEDGVDENGGDDRDAGEPSGKKDKDPETS